MARPTSQADVTAKLVVDGVLADIMARPRGEMPVEGVLMSQEERKAIGISMPGQTVFYAVGQSGVFFDMFEALAKVFFLDGDYERGLAAVETAMKKAYPSVKQAKKGPHPSRPNYNFYSYDLDVGRGSFWLHVEIDEPTARAEHKRFEVRVLHQAIGPRTNP